MRQKIWIAIAPLFGLGWILAVLCSRIYFPCCFLPNACIKVESRDLLALAKILALADFPINLCHFRVNVLAFGCWINLYFKRIWLADITAELHLLSSVSLTQNCWNLRGKVFMSVEYWKSWIFFLKWAKIPLILGLYRAQVRFPHFTNTSFKRQKRILELKNPG